MHALDRPRQDVKRDGVLVRRGRGGLQSSAVIKKSDGTGRRSGGIRDDFTERGERQVQFRRERPDELSVNVHHFSDRAENGIWMSDDWREGGREDLPFSRDTVINDRPGILGEGIPDHSHSVAVVW